MGKHAGDTAAGIFAPWLSPRPPEADEPWNRQPVSEAVLRDTLYRAVDTAMQRSPEVQQAQANLDAAMADVDEARGHRWPSLQIGTQSRALAVGSHSDNNPSRDPSLTLAVVTPVYDFGRTGNVIKSREQSAEATSQAYEAEREKIASVVCIALVELGKQRTLIYVGQQYVDRLNALVRMLGEIVKVDNGRMSELIQAKARLLQAQANLDATLASAREAELALRKLLGDTHPTLPAGQAWTLKPASVEDLLPQLDAHPLLQQARAEAAAARYYADSVKSAAWPSLNWIISKNTGRDAIGREQPWETRLALNWTAFSGGSVHASKLAALARASASEQHEAQLHLDTEYQVRAAAQDAQTLADRANAYRDLADETEQVRRAFFEQWYHLGRRTLLDVLTAESDYYGNQVNEVSYRYDGYLAVLREYASAGQLVAWLRHP